MRQLHIRLNDEQISQLERLMAMEPGVTGYSGAVRYAIGALAKQSQTDRQGHDEYMRTVENLNTTLAGQNEALRELINAISKMIGSLRDKEVKR